MLFHLLHNKLEEIEQTNKDEVAVVITPKRELDAKPLFFGRYSPVDVEVLAKIKLKFIDSYEELVQYLTDLHLVSAATGSRPRFLAIDVIDYYSELYES